MSGCRTVVRPSFVPALTAVALFLVPSPATAQVEPLQRLPVKCLVDSPERQGLEGCAILATRPFTYHGSAPLYWHIDRFRSIAAAKRASGPNSVAAEAHGHAWLMTVEPRHDRRHGGIHMAWLGPVTVPAGAPLTMRAQSTLLMPGGGTPVHMHSGPEVFYVISGAQCVETEAVAYRLYAGGSVIVPTDTVHRGRVLGSVPRRALALVLFDARRPGSTDLIAPPPLRYCE